MYDLVEQSIFVHHSMLVIVVKDVILMSACPVSPEFDTLLLQQYACILNSNFGTLKF